MFSKLDTIETNTLSLRFSNPPSFPMFSQTNGSKSPMVRPSSIAKPNLTPPLVLGGTAVPLKSYGPRHRATTQLAARKAGIKDLWPCSMCDVCMSCHLKVCIYIYIFNCSYTYMDTLTFFHMASCTRCIHKTKTSYVTCQYIFQSNDVPTPSSSTTPKLRLASIKKR